ncbi:Fic family protein [Frigidibacter sp. MR17.24]|uniref:Fic family protein n=1 Tax=Frigidibacter sp. MR17.24 TaxID=3127345 RepID=UPI00301302ED
MPWIWQSPAWPEFTCDAARLAAPLARATEAIGEIGGLQQGLDPAEREEMLLREIVSEARASFGIEGVTLDAAEIEASVVASLRHRDRAGFARRSDAIAALMLEARGHGAPLDAAVLGRWHRLLFHGIEVEDPGRWRQAGIEIVRSAAAGRQEVLFVAPPPERLEPEMARFLDWLAAETPEPLPVRAAIAHLWFETIHPFSDGNGRIGRAIVEHVFARGRALPFSLSRQIEREKRVYYEALQAGRHEAGGRIDATPFVEWFLDCLARAAGSARDEALFLLGRNRFFLRWTPKISPRAEAVLRRIFAQGAPRVAEGLSARSYARIAGVSGPTATRDLAALAEAGVLRRSEAGGRSTSYAIVLD